MTVRRTADVGDEVVAQAGMVVVRQAQAECRATQPVEDGLNRGHLAESLVRLKPEIEGVEVDDQHIVLGDSRCPFG